MWVLITVAIIKIFYHYYWCLCVDQLVYKISLKRATSVISDKMIQSKYRFQSTSLLLIEFSFLSVGVKTQTREKSQNEDCCVCGKPCWGWWKGSMLLNSTLYSTNNRFNLYLYMVKMQCHATNAWASVKYPNVKISVKLGFQSSF